jgi:hypothetical protein
MNVFVDLIADVVRIKQTDFIVCSTVVFSWPLGRYMAMYPSLLGPFPMFVIDLTRVITGVADMNGTGVSMRCQRVLWYGEVVGFENGNGGNTQDDGKGTSNIARLITHRNLKGERSG